MYSLHFIRGPVVVPVSYLPWLAHLVSRLVRGSMSSTSSGISILPKISVAIPAYSQRSANLLRNTPLSYIPWWHWDLFAFPLQTRKMLSLIYLPFSMSSYPFHWTQWKLLNCRKEEQKFHQTAKLKASLADFWTESQTRHAFSKLASNIP